MCVYIPIGSMYAIYGNIYHQYTPNVSICTTHGSYGISIGNKLQINMGAPSGFEPVFFFNTVTKLLEMPHRLSQTWWIFSWHGWHVGIGGWPKKQRPRLLQEPHYPTIYVNNLSWDFM